MKIAIVESTMTPAGHEVDYDRILVEEFHQAGHEVIFYVPEEYELKFDYGDLASTQYLPGKGISYAGVSGLKRIWLSAKRELKRLKWYNVMMKEAQKGSLDAILYPSPTYRYLRTLLKSDLKNSPIPVLLIMHGVTPKEYGKLLPLLQKLRKYPNIRVLGQTFTDTIFGCTESNLALIPPPIYIPRDLPNYTSQIVKPEVLKIGFFGQYRKEKNLGAFLEALCQCKFTRKVEFIIQGSTMKQADAADFERVIAQYSQVPFLTFLHKPLLGVDWQKALASVDAIVMPYANDRYRYHTSAMLSTAIGYGKPIVLADSMNPEVLERFDLGCSFELGSTTSLIQALEQFINNFDEKADHYEQEFKKAQDFYSLQRFTQGILAQAARGSGS